MNNFPKKKYRNCFLTDVICRLDFKLTPEADQSFFDTFQKIIEEEGKFPIFEKKSIMGLQAKFEKGKLIENAPMPAKPIYIYRDENKEICVQLSNDYLSIETKKYTDFRIFQKSIETALTIFLSLSDSFEFTRLGLRFINQIVLKRGNPLIWNQYIDSSLISPINNFFERSSNLARIMTNVVLNFDEYRVNFNYGMHNSEFPSKISRKEFILDFDFFTPFVEQDQIMPLLKEFNKESAIMFERCIKDKLREHMEVISE